MRRLMLQAAHAIDDCLIALALRVRTRATRVIQCAILRQDRRDIQLLTREQS